MKAIYICFILLFSSWITLSAQPPIAFYPFNGNANDVSGNGFNGTLYGTASANDTLVIGANATDFVSLPVNLFSGLTDFTVSFKVKFSSIQLLGADPANTILFVRGENFIVDLRLDYNGNSSEFEVTIQDQVVTFPLQAYIGEWYCFYVTRSSSQISVYVDGLQVGVSQSCPIGPLLPSALGFPNILGQDETNWVYFDGTQSLAGELDELKIYDYAFTEQQISSECFSCSDKAFYAYTTESFDSSGNNFHGTLHGNATVSNGILTLGDNATDYVSIPDASLAYLQDFDISFAVKFDAFHDTGASPVNTILWAWGYYQIDELVIRENINTNNFEVTVQHTESEFSFTPNLSEWYCAHVQRKEDSLFVYVNAQLIGTSIVPTDALQISSGGIVIGQQAHCPGSCFFANQSLAGSIDYFRISNCAFPVPNNEICNPTNVQYVSDEIPFSIFPNPADQFVKINFSQSKKVTASVFNMLGEEVLQMTSTSPNELILPTGNLQQGIYLLKLYDGNRNFSQKLVVNH